MVPVWFSLTSEWSKLLFGMSSAGAAFAAGGLVASGNVMHPITATALMAACLSFSTSAIYSEKAFDTSSKLVGSYLKPLDLRRQSLEEKRRKTLDEALGTIKKMQRRMLYAGILSVVVACLPRIFSFF